MFDWHDDVTTHNYIMLRQQFISWTCGLMHRLTTCHTFRFGFNSCMAKIYSVFKFVRRVWYLCRVSSYSGKWVPSVLWHCWLGGRKSIRPVKTEWWGDGVVICLELRADLHMAQLMPLPLTVSCFSRRQISFTLLVPAHQGSPGERAVKRVCVCVGN